MLFLGENTYPYLAILPLLFLYLLLGEKPFFPLPLQSRHLYRRLIDWIFIWIFFVSFCLWVHWCISAFFCVLHKCRPICTVQYLIFSKKQMITFFTHREGGFGRKIFQPDSDLVLQVTGSLFPGLSAGTGFCIFKVADGTSLYFPSQIKYFLFAFIWHTDRQAMKTLQNPVDL